MHFGIFALKLLGKACYFPIQFAYFRFLEVRLYVGGRQARSPFKLIVQFYRSLHHRVWKSLQEHQPYITFPFRVGING